MATAPPDRARDGSGSPALPPTRHDVGEQQLRQRVAGSLFSAPAQPVKVGRYVVLDRIGSGGLGVVFAAYDPKLDRKVALKVINPSHLTERAAARMQREAQAMAKITHGNVVAVHDTGAHGEGVFIAMELVDGVTLSEWVRAESRPWKAVRDVLVSAGRGLAAAHRQGLVHRDFKPANVLVDGADQARVLDFGLARAARDVEPEATASAERSLLNVELTQSGATLGTPAYMAPEQFEGRADTRSDQWGFCVTAYQALFGQRPFAGADYDTLYEAVCSGKVPPPPASATVPGFIHRALSRGLRVQPDQRFESMDALLHALDKDKRSRRVQLFALAGAVTLSSVATAGALWLSQPEPTAQSRAKLEQLEQDSRLAAEAGHYVYPAADADPQATALAGVIALEQLEGAIEDEAQAKATQLRTEFAAALVALGDEYWELEAGQAFASDYYAAALIFDPSADRARARSTLTPGELATLRDKALRATFTESELVGAAPLVALAEPDENKRAAKVAAILDRDEATADSTGRRLERIVGRRRRKPTPAAPPASVASARPPPVADDPPTRERSTAPARVAASEAGPTRDPAAAEAEAKQGVAALRRGDDAEAERAFHRALAKHSKNRTALQGLSELHFDRGTYSKALKYARKAVAVAPKSPGIRMQLGDAYFKVHRYDEARSAYVKAQGLGAAEATKAIAKVDARLGD
ncbi:MAG: protein kinase [Myxococcota bacterium]